MESTPKKEITQEPGVTLAEYLNDILVEEKVAQTILSKGKYETPWLRYKNN